MDAQRRSLLKMAAAGALLSLGGTATGAYAGDEFKSVLNLWHQLRFRVAMNATPSRNPDIIARKKGRETVLCSRSQGQEIMILNPMAGRIWEMCDGAHRTEDMIRAIVKRFDVPPTRCRGDVLLTVAVLERRGMINV